MHCTKLIALALLPLTALAGQPKHCPIKPGKPHTASPVAQSQSAAIAQSASRSAAHSSSNSASHATGGNAAATGGRSSSTSSAQGGAGGDASSYNANTNTVAGGDASGQVASTTIDERQVRQTPPAIAGNVQPTASCKNAINGGASAPMAGLSFGIGKSDDECDMRETAREFYEMQQPQLAIALLCQTKAARKLANCAYVAPAEERTYTRTQVADIVRKAVSK